MLSHSVPLTCDLCQQAIALNAHFYKLDHCYQDRLDDNMLSHPITLITHSACVTCATLRLVWALHLPKIEPTTTTPVQSVRLQRCIYLSEQCIHPLPYFLTTSHYQPFLKESVCDTSLYAAPSSAPA